jgi:hypothetical protein
MLETIVVILLILWALGLFAFNVGNLIHILLVIAIIVIWSASSRGGARCDPQVSIAAS